MDKKSIVINNYFYNDCDVNTSIKDAYTKGFNRGCSKALKDKEYSKRKYGYEELRNEIHVILNRFFEREFDCAMANEFDFEWKECCVDDVLRVIRQQGGSCWEDDV